MLFLLIFVIPALFIFWILSTSKNKNGKAWLKPFTSHLDFLKEIYSLISITFVGISWWLVFAEIVKNNPNNNSTWFVELWILGFILLILAIAFYIRSYFALVIGIISSTIYSAVQLVKWSYDSYYFILKDNLQEIDGQKLITPVAGLALFWILINLIYFVGKSMSVTKVFGRTGNIVRALVIFTNLFILGIFANSIYISNVLSNFLKHNSIIFSWPLLLTAFILTIISGFTYFFHTKINLKPFEISLSIIPGFLLLIYSFFPFINLNSDTNIENDAAKLIWAIIFNILYLTYAIYLINKSSRTQERWLKIYSIILIVGVILEKFVDISINLNFSGIFLTIFGGVVMIAVATIEFLRRKTNTN